MIENDLYSTSSPNGCSRYLKNADKNIPELKELISTQLQEILTAYYGCCFTISDISAKRNNHVPGINRICIGVLGNQSLFNGNNPISFHANISPVPAVACSINNSAIGDDEVGGLLGKQN